MPSIDSAVEICDSTINCELESLSHALRRWASSQSPAAKSLIGILCRQIRTLQMDPDRPGLRDLMRSTMQQLVSEQQIGR